MRIKHRTATGGMGLAVALTLMIAGLLLACAETIAVASGTSDREWPHYGGDLAGTRYTPLTQINKSNVAELQVAWIARTGDASHDDGSEDAAAQGQEVGCGRCHQGDSKFETTPLMVDGRLLVSTPLQRILALHPETGEEEWRHDPKIDMALQDRNEGYVSRGVAYWRAQDRGQREALCGKRVLYGTIDARLLAIDANSGEPCEDFGDGGTVRLDVGVGEVQIGQYGVTSPPIVVGDVVVVGSSMGDNRRIDMERGTVRAFDVRSGELLWGFDPVPRTPEHPGWDTWEAGAAEITGAANAWAPLAADEDLGLVYIPTGSAAPDFYGGEREGENLFSNSVVALDVETGELRWHFQVVHHDLWDYDVASPPTLTEIEHAGRSVPVAIVATKTGMVFVLDRRDGTPLWPVEERPVPASDVPGEAAWPTQPFPTVPAPLHPLGMTEDDVWGINEEEYQYCLNQFQSFRNDGVFTPPSLQGTLLYPGYAGGFQWGGVSIDEERDMMILNRLQIPFWVRLHERQSPNEGNQRGTPYTMTRAMFASPMGIPCSRPPWGLITGVRLSTGEVVWEKPFGVAPGFEEVPEAKEWGTLNIGGSILTASGLTIAGSTADGMIRAFDTETGDLLWEDQLPAGGQATPMTYAINGTQYIVIAAGGHASLGQPPADYVVAYALPGERQ